MVKIVNLVVCILPQFKTEWRAQLILKTEQKKEREIWMTLLWRITAGWRHGCLYWSIRPVITYHKLSYWILRQHGAPVNVPDTVHHTAAPWDRQHRGQELTEAQSRYVACLTHSWGGQVRTQCVWLRTPKPLTNIHTVSLKIQMTLALKH